MTVVTDLVPAAFAALMRAFMPEASHLWVGRKTGELWGMRSGRYHRRGWEILHEDPPRSSDKG